MEMGGVDPAYMAQHMNGQSWDELRRITGCQTQEECWEELTEVAEHPKWFCSGEPAVAEGGSKIGHILPGVMFIIWGAHWLFAQIRTYHRSRVENQSWETKCSYQLSKLPFWSESFFKAVLPVLAMMLELWLVHEHGYRNLLCPKGSTREGHMVGNHINNWQHAMLYPPIIASGIVDLINCQVSLPKGTTQLFLSFMYGNQMLLLGLHKKHTPLDVIAHEMIFWCMVVLLAMCLAEIAFPHNVIFALGRSATTLVIGMWLIAMAHILFTGDPKWSEHRHDEAAAMYAPIVFVMVAVLAIFITVGTYLAVQFYYQKLYKSSNSKSSFWAPDRHQDFSMGQQHKKGQSSSSSSSSSSGEDNYDKCSHSSGSGSCGSSSRDDVNVDISIISKAKEHMHKDDSSEHECLC